MNSFIRFVTKIRWVVEVINGSIKHFRALDGTIQNSVLNHTMEDFRIAAALLNCFFEPLKSDATDSLDIAREMKKKLEKKNDLEYILKQKNTRKSTEK